MSHLKATLVTIVTVVFMSDVALACPQCAGREEWSMASFAILASMVLFPFVVVTITWKAVKRLINPGGMTPGLSEGDNIG